MSIFYEKIAAENQDLANTIAEVAKEEFDNLSDDEKLEMLEYFLTEDGLDLTDASVQNEIKQASDQELYLYGLEKIAELISADIVNNIDKVAAGEAGFETQAASRAIENFLDVHGSAVLGSTFGMGDNAIGTVVTPGTDKNVFGGFGSKLFRTNYSPYTVNSTGILTNLIRGTNMNTFKFASEDEQLFNFFIEKVAEAAEYEDQSVEEFLYDLGLEALEDEILNSENIDINKLSLHDSKVATKQASTVALDFVEKVASETGYTPEDLVIEYGFEKAAEYVGDVIDKMAAGEKLKNFLKTTKGKTILGLLAGGVAGGIRSALKNKDEEELTTKDRILQIAKGVGIGGAIGAGAGMGLGYATNKIKQVKNEPDYANMGFGKKIKSLGQNILTDAKNLFKRKSKGEGGKTASADYASILETIAREKLYS